MRFERNFRSFFFFSSSFGLRSVSPCVEKYVTKMSNLQTSKNVCLQEKFAYELTDDVNLMENVGTWPHLRKFLPKRKRMNGHVDKRKALRRNICKCKSRLKNMHRKKQNFIRHFPIETLSWYRLMKKCAERSEAKFHVD